MLNFLPIILYPEIHYHLGLIYPLYFRRLPEIIADLPYRINIKSESSIPILLIIKDAHKFPILLDRVIITILSKEINIQKEIKLNLSLQDKYFSKIITLDIPDIDISQSAEIAITFYITRVKDGREFVIKNDDLPGLHNKLNTFLSREPLPSLPDWYAGEPHFHSNFTEDQAEFGADVNSAVKLAKRMDIDWLFITDHSYDLDDEKDNYLKNDPELPKWKKLKQTVKKVQTDEKFPVLFGEELSCGNLNNQNIHLLIVNNENFISGFGDSAEKWFHNKPTFSLSKVCKMIDNNSLIISAHPFETQFNPISKILLRRGIWTEKDITENNIQYLQIINRSSRWAIAKAKKKWINLLLNGYKAIILAGNDAHGYFNIKREVGIPFISLFASSNQIFGNFKTYFKSNCKITSKNFIAEFRKNRIIVSNGPFVTFTINDFEIGADVKYSDNYACKINALSSSEFGHIITVLVYSGVKKGNKEKLEKSWKISNYTFAESIKLINNNQSYFRVEIYTDKKKFCWTNPIWIKK